MEQYHFDAKRADYNKWALDTLLSNVKDEQQKDEIDLWLRTFGDTDALNALNTEDEVAGGFAAYCEHTRDFYFQFLYAGPGVGVVQVFQVPPKDNPLVQRTLEAALIAVDSLVALKDTAPKVFTAISQSLRAKRSESVLNDADTNELVAYLAAQ